jgi:hypothetical protein
MRITIKGLQNELKKANQETEIYKAQLEQIRSVLFPHSSSYAHTNKDILPEIARLVGYRSYNQGAINPDRETIHILKEIIRWKVNPETAMESKVQERMDGFRK